MNMSEVIERFLMQLLDEAEDGMAEIGRNTLASRFKCSPSQINYVISTRFTPERGFRVESRRGGGGYVKIVRLAIDTGNYIMQIINSVGAQITAETADAIVRSAARDSSIAPRDAALLIHILCGRPLAALPQPSQNTLRAQLLKEMLLTMSE